MPLCSVASQGNVVFDNFYGVNRIGASSLGCIKSNGTSSLGCKSNNYIWCRPKTELGLVCERWSMRGCLVIPYHACSGLLTFACFLHTSIINKSNGQLQLQCFQVALSSNNLVIGVTAEWVNWLCYLINRQQTQEMLWLEFKPSVNYVIIKFLGVSKSY